MQTDMDSYVRDITSLRLANTDDAGGKGENLGRVSSAALTDVLRWLGIPSAAPQA